jgi:hypothetical protein
LAGAQHDPAAALLFCHPQNVDLSIVNGRILVQEGHLLTLDLPLLVAQHNATSHKLITST